MARTTQRDVIRNLNRRLDGDHDKVVAAYAAAERRGEVARASNVRGMEPEEYAERLLPGRRQQGVDPVMDYSSGVRPSFDEVFATWEGCLPTIRADD